MNIKTSILLRVRLAFILVMILGLVIAYKIFDIQVFQGQEWSAMAKRIGLQYRVVKATRGNILSDNGSLLATSLPFYKVAFDPSRASHSLFTSQIDTLSYLLSRHFGDRTPGEYRQLITDARVSGKRYLVLNRSLIDYQEKKTMTSWPVFEKGRMKGGVIFEKVEKRFQPFNYLADRTIGFINENEVGAGLEYSFNQDLAGRDGKALYQKVAGGNWKPIFDGSEIRPKDGYDLVTTIDVNLQDVAEDALLRALERHDADYGSAIVMEVSTGKIKAMSNLSRLSKGRYGERYNHAVGEQGLREPGSTFKLATMIALLEETDISLSDQIETGDGTLQIYEHTVRDHDEEGFGTITVQEAFELSSNVAMAKLADHYFGLKPRKFYGYIEDLGLNSPIDFQMVGEGVPKVKHPDEWSGITLPWMAHGYGLEITPLHTLMLYNAVANDGRMVKPIIVSDVYQADKLLRHFKTETVKRQICSKETLRHIRQMLEGVVENGTAQNIKTEHYKIAGKTGTAVTLKNGRYSKEYYTSFAGYFPAEAPLYSCIVVIQNPRGFFKYGNNVAAPVFREISDKIHAGNPAMQEILSQDFSREKGVFPVIRSGNIEDLTLICNELGISNHAATEDAWVKTRINNNAIEWKSNPITNNLMPDVTGMTLRDALFILENKGLSVETNGKGRVLEQSIPPGRRLANTGTVTLRLG